MIYSLSIGLFQHLQVPEGVIIPIFLHPGVTVNDHPSCMEVSAAVFLCSSSTIKDEAAGAFERKQR